MTGRSSSRSTTVGEWVSLERTVAPVSGGCIATVTLEAPDAPVPVEVSVVETVPEGLTVLEIGVHPDRQPDAFRADASGVAFSHVVEPGDRVEVVYGIRVTDAEAVELGPLAIESESLVEPGADRTAAVTADGGLSAIPLPSDGFATAPRTDGDGTGGIQWPTEDEASDDGAGGRGTDAETGSEDAAPPDGSGFVFPSDDRAPAEADDDPVPADVDDAPAPPGADDDPAAADAADGAEDPAVAAGGRPSTAEVGAPGDGVTDRDPTGDAEVEPGGAASQDPGEVHAVEPANRGGLDDTGAEVDPGTLDDVTSLLVLSDAHETDDGCTDLLGHQLAPDDGLVLVSFVPSADDRLEALAALPGQRDIDLVSMGEPTESSPADATTVASPVGEATVTAIADANDLFRLGVHLGRELDGADGRPALCLHSLTALLGLSDLQRVFRFLHVLSGRVAAVDGRAHYHLDPGAVDEEALGTLRPLFDAVVAYEDGRWVEA